MNVLEHNLLTIARQAPPAERLFAARSYQGQSVGPEVMEIRRRPTIILSSPHATNHPRDGQARQADMFSATLAIQLAGLLGASAVIAARTTDEDPNAGADGHIKRLLRSLVARARAGVVLNRHSMSQQRPVDVTCGTASSPTPGQRPILLSTLIETLTNAGFDNVGRDRLLPAARPTPIAPFPWRTCQMPGLQIEIHRRFRNPARDPAASATLLSLLREALHTLQRLR
jgi:hypothetical protein